MKKEKLEQSVIWKVLIQDWEKAIEEQDKKHNDYFDKGDFNKAAIHEHVAAAIEACLSHLKINIQKEKAYIDFTNFYKKIKK
tara:strand:+ start:90 stop:335 length:246 start_codon:yes stop_codon:yes gene_type:complete